MASISTEIGATFCHFCPAEHAGLQEIKLLHGTELLRAEKQNLPFVLG